MDGRLWPIVYKEVRRACKAQVPPRRRGHPDQHPLEAVIAVWLFAAMMNWPLSVTHQRLTHGATGWWLRRHFHWRWPIPSLATLSRRAKKPAFRQVLLEVLERCRSPVLDKKVKLAFMDATILLTGFYSHDAQSTWTCHGGKWLRGYALHVILDAARGLRAWAVHSANVQEMKVAQELVQQAAMTGPSEVNTLAADSGYDSEPLHEAVEETLGARLLAPLNRRGGKCPVRQPHRRASARALRTPQGKTALEQRNELERWLGRLKGYGQLTALPPFIRHLDRVTIWVMLKMVLFLHHERLNMLDRKAA
jgi:IS5 family transposase